MLHFSKKKSAWTDACYFITCCSSAEIRAQRRSERERRENAKTRHKHDEHKQSQQEPDQSNNASCKHVTQHWDLIIRPNLRRSLQSTSVWVFPSVHPTIIKTVYSVNIRSVSSTHRWRSEYGRRVLHGGCPLHPRGRSNAENKFNCTWCISSPQEAVCINMAL